MSKNILLFAAVAVAVGLLISSMEPKNKVVTEFENFKTQHGKFYMTPTEESYRKSIFLMNLAKIEAHNADKTQTHTLGVTPFADLTQE